MNKAVGRRAIMSDAGIVLRGHHELLTLFRKVNHSTIILKKHYFHLHEVGQGNKREISEAKKFLIGLVKYILVEIAGESTSREWVEGHSQTTTSFVGNHREQYADDEDTSDDEEYSTSVSVVERRPVVRSGYNRTPAKDEIFLAVPPLFILHLRQRHKEALQSYGDDLRELQEALAGAKKFTDTHISRLDDLCGELDTELTLTKRKLQRR